MRFGILRLVVLEEVKAKMWGLRQFRLSLKWLVLLLSFVALVLITAAPISHHADGAGADPECLLCKVGHQPLQSDTAWLPCKLPSPSRAATLPDVPSDETASSVKLAPSRAPPA